MIPWTVAHHPWNFPDKNTRVGCHFLFQSIFLTHGSNPCLLGLLHQQENSLPLQHPGSPIMKLSACEVSTIMSDSLQPYGLQPARLLCPWDFPVKDTGVGCHYCAFKNLLVGQISWYIFLLQHKIKKEINQTIIYKIFRKETTKNI